MAEPGVAGSVCPLLSCKALFLGSLFLRAAWNESSLSGREKKRDGETTMRKGGQQVRSPAPIPSCAPRSFLFKRNSPGCCTSTVWNGRPFLRQSFPNLGNLNSQDTWTF